MGIDAGREVRQVQLHQFVVIELFPALGNVAITVKHLLLGFGLGERLLVQALLQEVELDPLAPALAQLVRRIGKVQGVVIGAHRFLDREVVGRLYQLLDQLHALGNARGKPFVDLVGEGHVALKELGAELAFGGLELVDIALLEIELGWIEGLEEAVEQTLGDLLTDVRLAQVQILKVITNHLGDEAVVLARHRLGRRLPCEQQKARDGQVDEKTTPGLGDALRHGRDALG